MVLLYTLFREVRCQMKVFEGGEPKEWRGKVNFVDKNNVLVGFDDDQNCCEQCGWFLNRSKPTADMLDGDLDHKDLEEYVHWRERAEEAEKATADFVKHGGLE